MFDRDTFLEMLETLERRGLISAPVSYSGRGMYGRRCVAVKGDDVTEWGLALYLAQIADEFAGVDVFDIPEPSTESLGHSFVMYWRGMDWPEGRRDRDDDEEEEG